MEKVDTSKNAGPYHLIWTCLFLQPTGPFYSLSKTINASETRLIIECCASHWGVFNPSIRQSLVRKRTKKFLSLHDNVTDICSLNMMMTMRISRGSNDMGLDKTERTAYSFHAERSIRSKL